MKTFLYKIYKSVETVLEGLFLMGVIVAVSATAAVFFPTRWIYLEIRDTWVE